MFRVLRLDMRLTDKAILYHIATMREPASQEELARSLSCGVQTIRRSTRRMANAGYLTIIGSGNRIPYRYLINYDSLPESVRDELRQ